MWRGTRSDRFQMGSRRCFRRFARRASEGSARRFAPLGKTGFYHRPEPKASANFRFKNAGIRQPLASPRIGTEKIFRPRAPRRPVRRRGTTSGIVRPGVRRAVPSGVSVFRNAPRGGLFRKQRRIRRFGDGRGARSGAEPPRRAPRFSPCGVAAGCGRIAWQHRTLETAGRPAGPAKR